MAVTIGANQAKQLLQSGMAQAEELVKNPAAVESILQQFKEYLKKVPVIGESLADVPEVVSLIGAYITQKYTEISPKVIASLLGAVIYMIKKEDLVPDSLPLISMADDIAVLGLALKMCEPELTAFKEWKKEAAAEEDRESEDNSGNAEA